MTEPAGSGGLRTIFSFFLGLMLTAFVGVGVYTFLPPPDVHEAELRALQRQEEEIRTGRAPDALTEEDRSEIREISRRRSELDEAAAEARTPWGRNTSVILIVFATLAMAVSLVRADRLPVISNGLLLGGVFIMLYGVGWIIATDTSTARFAVITVALAITLGLGYARFVRRGAAVPAATGPGPAEATEDPGLEARVRDLEERMNEAASALGADRRRSPPH